MTLTEVFEDLLTDTEWHRRAACRDMPSDLFVPTIGGADRSSIAKAARRWARGTASTLLVCRECPVRSDCADYARRHDIHFGIWGGRCLGRDPSGRGR